MKDGVTIAAELWIGAHRASSPVREAATRCGAADCAETLIAVDSPAVAGRVAMPIAVDSPAVAGRVAMLIAVDSPAIA